MDSKEWYDRASKLTLHEKCLVCGADKDSGVEQMWVIDVRNHMVVICIRCYRGMVLNSFHYMIDEVEARELFSEHMALFEIWMGARPSIESLRQDE